MDSQASAREMSQIARLLFDSAASYWYLATALEIVAGFLGFALIVAGASGTFGLSGAGVGVALLVTAYVMRLIAEDRYDSAETMRRQSVFAEGLGWSVSTWQMAVWRQKVGKRIRAEARKTPRPDDYFATSADTGPSKLAEMTTESAFFTHHLYCELRKWIGVALAIIAVAIVVGLGMSAYLSADLERFITHLVYAIIPIIVTTDLLGWWLRLSRATAGISDVQKGLEHAGSAIDEPQMLRLVAEYDSHIARGVPIHNRLFCHFHPEIQDLWQQRHLAS